MDTNPLPRTALRTAGAAIVTATALTLTGCLGHGVRDAPRNQAPATTADAPPEEQPILDAADLPTVDDANLDRTDPSSVSYHWLTIARTIKPDLDSKGESYQRVRSLSTPEFQKANEETHLHGFTSPWYLQGENPSDPVASVNAEVTAMSAPDEFHEFGDQRTREWTVLQKAVTRSGQVLNKQTGRVLVTMVPDGDNWLVDRTDVPPKD
jgi:hypothetical protein